MNFNIEITSQPKGSNPGGRCLVPWNGNSDKITPAYIKYCNSSIVNDLSLNPRNQPVYEALTLEMAEKLGLSVPDSRVILNSPPNLRFFYAHEEGEGKIASLSENRPKYFVSQINLGNLKCDPKELEFPMNEQRIYRDLLNIGDIYNKAQNYSLIRDPSTGQCFLLYLDLGCGFVDCHDGKLSLRNSLGKKVSTSNGSHIKKIKHSLEDKSIVTANGELINLLDFEEGMSRQRIKTIDTNHPGKVELVKLEDLISPEEILDLKKLYLLNAEGFLVNYKKDPRLIRQ